MPASANINDICPECRSSAVSATATSPQLRISATVRQRRPPVTTALLAINVAVFAAMALTGVSPAEPTVLQLVRWGATWGPLTLGGESWRLLTSNYVHAGIIHIALNMWCLWNLGNLAERIFDPWTYFLAYTASGVAGSLVSTWWHPLVVGVGASGAIFGIAGMSIAALYLGHLPIPKQALQRTLKSLVMFAIYNLAFGAVGAGIDNSAHLGGLGAGLVLGAVFAGHLRAPEETKRNFRLVVFVVAFLLLLGGMTYVKHRNASVVRYRTLMQQNQP